MVDEINPTHPVTEAVRKEWHKIAGLLMHKFRVDEVLLTTEDVQSFAARPGGPNIALIARDGYILLKLVNDVDARDMAQKERAEGRDT